MHVRVTKGTYNRQEVTPKGRTLVMYREGDELDVSDHVQHAYRHRLEPCAPPLRARGRAIAPASQPPAPPPAPPAAADLRAAPSIEGPDTATGGAGTHEPPGSGNAETSEAPRPRKNRAKAAASA
jgi:hypothetical protein